MENIRYLLLGAMGVVILLAYQAWQKDYPEVAQYTSQTLSEPAPGEIATPPLDDIPEIGAQAQSTDGTPVANVDKPKAAADRIVVRTDVYRIEIDLAGGDIRKLELLEYPAEKGDDAPPLAFLNDTQPNFFVINSGLVATDRDAPDHKAQFSAERRRYLLADGRDDIIVPLRWTAESGRTVIKTYRFRRSSYEIDLIWSLANETEADWTWSPYARYWRTPHNAAGEPPFIQSFLGAAAYERESDGKFKFRKYAVDELSDEPISLEQQGGWIAMLQHYFVAAILPPEQDMNRFYSRPSKTFGFLAEYVGSRRTLEPGADAQFTIRLFIGPKLQDRLEDIAPGLNLTVDYGLLTAISEPLFWVLDKIHDLIGNWGWSIVVLTLLIKGAFYKLSEAQYRSMARMKKFAPRIQAIKERYADDRERLHKAMTELYTKEGFNPLAGCWPMLVQFPVFIALYWVLLESVELRQADFMFWLNDLSAPDPFYVLPVLFGISMFAQQKLSGSAMTMEPMQQRIMNIMPIGLTVFFAFFPVGLVLYWLVSNLIGIAQQWYITRKLLREDTVKKR